MGWLREPGGGGEQGWKAGHQEVGMWVPVCDVIVSRNVSAQQQQRQQQQQQPGAALHNTEGHNWTRGYVHSRYDFIPKLFQ